MFNKIKRWLFKQFQDNFIIYFLVIIIFAIGIIIGSITIKIIGLEQKNDLIIFLSSFFKNIDGDKISNSLILKQSITDNFKTVGLIWISGIIFIAVPLIPIIVLFRGFALGFTVGFLVNEYGMEGFLFSVLGILPQNLFIIPGILSIASISMAYSIKCIKMRKLRVKSINNVSKILDYTTLIVLLSIVIIIGCLIEAYVSPMFLRLLTDYIN
ncbi:stage II sporulation protein M [Schnuerera sp.]|uniref:stage II sporulation protein M n=1 Tax=Schnuerera sp. TaxID=2794844 RepID=UPI002B6F1C6B|nr:stage II sporulation protein M [Schnuerera sp.]HSH37069.1 stage II sporulation protein M [Schnuerera sp.]